VKVHHVARHIHSIVPYARKLEGEVRVRILHDNGMAWKIHLQTTGEDADLLLRVVLRADDGGDLAAVEDAARDWVAELVAPGDQLHEKLRGQYLLPVVIERGAIPIAPSTEYYIVHGLCSLSSSRLARGRPATIWADIAITVVAVP